MEEGDVKPPASVSRPSVRDAMLSMLAAIRKEGQELLVSGKVGSENSGESAMSLLLPSTTSDSLFPGDLCGFLELASEQSCAFDRITATADPCWILTVSSNNEDEMVWASKANALLQHRRRKKDRMLDYCTEFQNLSPPRVRQIWNSSVGGSS